MSFKLDTSDVSLGAIPPRSEFVLRPLARSLLAGADLDRAVALGALRTCGTPGPKAIYSVAEIVALRGRPVSDAEWAMATAANASRLRAYRKFYAKKRAA